MKKLLYYCLLGQLALASCATLKPPPPDTPPPAGTPATDSTARSQATAPLPLMLTTPPPSLLDQLLHRTPATVATRGLPAKVKNATLNVYYGPAVVTSTTTAKNGRTIAGDGASNTEAAKKAGPVTQASPQAQVHVAATKKGPAQAGDGNTATTSSGLPWWWWLLMAAGVTYGGFRLYKRFTPT